MLTDYYATCAIPKGKTRKQLKAKAGRAEAAQKRRVRAQCVERDGKCRVGRFIVLRGEDGWQLGRAWGWCDGPSEWAHTESARRFKTRSMRPEARHSTQGTAMLCKFHHQEYDAHRLQLVWLTPLGCDGPLLWHSGDVTYTEAQR